jgi:DNA repair photolyase
VATFVPLLAREQVERLPERAREVVEYRKSGLSLNHIQGCPLDCAYCIRHTYGLWDARQPHALMSDAEAVNELVSHRYFQPHITPVQVFNRATDLFLPKVRPHTFAVLEDLDKRGLTNHVLVITRHQMHHKQHPSGGEHKARHDRMKTLRRLQSRKPQEIDTVR